MTNKVEDNKYKDNISFRRELLSKHSQLMQMYLRHNNPKMAQEQFEILKPNFQFLHEQGETMSWYTPEEFEEDSKQFEKMKPLKKRVGRVISKTERMAYVKEHFNMTPHDVLVIAHHVLGHNVIMVGQLDDLQWQEVIDQAMDFQKDGVLASYLGHK